MLSKQWQAVLPADAVSVAEALYHKASEERGAGVVIYPEQENIFAAYDLTPPDSVRCVILGQDPYHGAGQAHGLAFSVLDGVKLPPSLKNIYKELEADLGTPAPLSGDLSFWAKQGVLLLNTCLTVEEGKAASHAKWGWQTLTLATVQACAKLRPEPVFILWGNHAQKVASDGGIDLESERVIVSAHPSPLSAKGGFFGSKPFSRANALLEEPVLWGKQRL